MRKLRGVPNLKGNLLLVGKFTPWIFRNEIESLHIDHLAILRLWIIAVGYIDDIASDVLLDHEPRATTQAQSLALSDRMKPIAVMLTHDLTRLQLHDLAGAFPQVTLDKLIVVDFP